MAKRGKFSVAEGRFMLRAASAYLDDIRKNASDEAIQRLIAEESGINEGGYPYIRIDVTAGCVLDEGVAIVYALLFPLAEYRTQSTGAIRRVVTHREKPEEK